MTCRTEIERKARRAYTCLWCGEKIGKGEVYTRIKGNDNDVDWFSVAMHIECKAATRQVTLCASLDWDDDNHEPKFKRGTAEPNI